MFRFIKNNTSEEDILVFFELRIVRLITDRMSVFCSGAQYVGVGDYLVVYKKYDDVLKSIPHQKTVFENAQFTVQDIRSLTTFFGSAQQVVMDFQLDLSLLRWGDDTITT